MLDRKELFKNTLKKSAHAWKRINELRLTGIFFPLHSKLFLLKFLGYYFGRNTSATMPLLVPIKVLSNINNDNIAVRYINWYMDQAVMVKHNKKSTFILCNFFLYSFSFIFFIFTLVSSLFFVFSHPQSYLLFCLVTVITPLTLIDTYP